MANSYNLAVDLEPVQTVVDAIRAVDVPAITADIGTVDTVVDAIRATDVVNIRQDIDDVETDVGVVGAAVVGLNDLSAAEVNTQVDNALNTAIPGSPAAGSINERIEEFHNRKTYDSINYLISDDILHSNDDLVDSDEIAFAVKKKITCPITETIRIEFKIKTKGLAVQFAHGRIYKNGVALGADQATSTVNWETFSEDLIFSASDLIELWCYGWPGPIGYQMKEFRILGIVYQEFENTMV